jgi:hypothetical protein
MFRLPLTLTAPQNFSMNLSSTYALSGDIDLNGFDLSIEAGNTHILSIEAPISGAGNLELRNSNVYIQSLNRFPGTTTVVSGTVQVYNGSLAGPVNVTSGGIFGGFGPVGGPVTLTSGYLAPYDPSLSVGQPSTTLFTGGLDLQDGASTNPNRTRLIIFTNGPPLLNVTGAVHLGGQLDFGRQPNDAPRPDHTYTLIDNDGTDPIVGTFLNYPEGALVESTPVPLRISYHGGDGNDVTLTGISQPAYSVGAGPGGGPQVNVYDGGGNLVRTFLAYEASFRGGVHVATADVTGDGVPDTVTAPGNGGGPVIRIWDGVTGALVREFLAYDGKFRGGASLAIANVFQTSGVPQIVTGPGPGGGPHVRVFDATTGAVRSEWLAYDAHFMGGISVTATAATTSSPGFVITGPGPGGGPHVRIFDGVHGIAYGYDFLAYDAAFHGGVNVAATEFFVPQFTLRIVTTPASGGGPVVRVWDLSGLNLPRTLNQEFLAYEPTFFGGVNVALAPVAADGGQAILTGPGVGGGPVLFQFELFESGRTRTRATIAFDPAFLGGIYVG